MVDSDRIREFEEYVAFWDKGLTDMTEYRDRLLDYERIGLTISDESGNDVLQDRIKEVDKAVITFDKILTSMKARRNLAISGEDV